MKYFLCAATAVFGSALPLSSAQAALFMDNFDTAASSTNYTAVSSSTDVAVTYAFDYSALGIASAPNSTGGSTLGLKLEANIAAPASVEGVTLHTTQQFTGAYRVQFDAWINANGPFPGGGAGSTEFLTAGVGGNGTAVNLGATGSGGWTAVSGEGGSTRDYRAYKGVNEQFAESGQFSAGNSSAGGGAHNSSDPYYAQFGNVDVSALGQGGSQTGTTGPGTFGFEWHTVVLEVDPTGGAAGDPSMTWTIDGLQIAKLDAGLGSTFATDGSVTIGYMDIFTSVSDASTFSFGLIDNLSVSAVPEPSSFAFALGLVLTGACYRRRR